MGLRGWFAPKCPVPDHEWEWILACVRWLEEEFPRENTSAGASQQILPTAENFPDVSGNLEERAQQLFLRTKRFAELDDWPTELVGYETTSPSQLLSPHLMGAHKWSDAVGTFQLVPDGSDGWIARISYDIAQLHSPTAFVATMAHELAHYLLSTAKRCPPGGWDLHELATDMTAIWMGFGIFLANNAKSFESFSDHDRQGWQARTSGYLNERAIVTAMGLCMTIRGDNPADAIPHLKPYLVRGYKQAIGFIEQSDIDRMLSEVDLDDFGVDAVEAV